MTPILVSALDDRDHRVRGTAALFVYQIAGELSSGRCYRLANNPLVGERLKEAEVKRHTETALTLIEMDARSKFKSLLEDSNDDVQSIAHKLWPDLDRYLEALGKFMPMRITDGRTRSDLGLGI
jgi:hypothetical protein